MSVMTEVVVLGLVAAAAILIRRMVTRAYERRRTTQLHQLIGCYRCAADIMAAQRGHYLSPECPCCGRGRPTRRAETKV